MAAQAGGDAPARLEVLKKRREFLAAAKAFRWNAAGFGLQARPRTAQEDGPAGATGPRVGYTCSKKVGNAVARNRAKRRLRAAAALVLPGVARQGWDYVLIGRPDSTAALPFTQLVADLGAAVARLHAKAP